GSATDSARPSSERQASVASTRPTTRLRSPAASSIVVPPTSPITSAPSASSSVRSPLRTKPPVPSPKSASSGEQPRSRRSCRSARQPRPEAIADAARAHGVAHLLAGGGDRGDVGLRQPRRQLAPLLRQLRPVRGGGERAEQGD